MPIQKLHILTLSKQVLICAMCAILQHKEHDVAKLASEEEIRDARETNDNNDKYVHDAKPALVDGFKSVEDDLQEVNFLIKVGKP